MMTDASDTITKLTLQSQAGWVLVTGALLAESLERLLLAKMRTLSNKKAKQIVKNCTSRPYCHSRHQERVRALNY